MDTVRLVRPDRVLAPLFREGRTKLYQSVLFVSKFVTNYTMETTSCSYAEISSSYSLGQLKGHHNLKLPATVPRQGSKARRWRREVKKEQRRAGRGRQKKPEKEKKKKEKREEKMIKKY